MRSLAAAFAVASALSALACTTPTSTTTTSTTTETPPVAHGTVEHTCERAAEGFDCTGCAAVAGSDPVQTPSCLRDEGSCPLACCGLCAKE